MIRQYELVERVRDYDPACDENLLNKAYVFAMRAHGNQTRASGDPYFSHPLEVAGILTDLKLDSATIATALLHDTVEDTLATPEEIKREFGDEVSGMVDGVTKLSQIELSSESAKQAENFRKLLIAMSRDLRVLLVKLADRLHNMRTLEFVPKPEKRKRIALETMEIYAPLAGRIGMHEMREELEDLAFMQLNADARSSILNRLTFLRDRSGDIIGRIQKDLGRVLKEHDVDAEVIGREKRPFSIWRKMETKDISFEQLSDVFGFRVLVDDEPDCYKALGVIHQSWRMVPGRFKDYISTPKRNGYRSIHTTVIGPERQRVEIQIRTQAMHDVAERGLAAHWRYKELAGGKPERLSHSEEDAYRWLRSLVELVEHADTAEEFLEHTKLEMFLDQVFCFTPRGDLIALPRGATPIDFAYAVHTDVGDTCVGAKINGRRMPLRTRLNNGDQVEIIRSKTQKPNPEWEHFAVTGRARSAIRRFTRAEEKAQYRALGRQLIDHAARREDLEVTDKGLRAIATRFKLEGADDVLIAIGKGELGSMDALEAMFPGLRLKTAARWFMSGGRRSVKDKSVNGAPAHGAIPIKGLLPGLAVHYATCCHPLPGDRIVGILTEGKGVQIHTIDCAELAKKSADQETWLDLSWQAAAEIASGSNHVGRIKGVLLNETGSLGQFCTVIGRGDGNITNLQIGERTPDYFEIEVDIEVRDAKHLMDIVAALRAIETVTSMERVREVGEG